MISNLMKIFWFFSFFGAVCFWGAWFVLSIVLWGFSVSPLAIRLSVFVSFAAGLCARIYIGPD